MWWTCWQKVVHLHIQQAQIIIIIYMVLSAHHVTKGHFTYRKQENKMFYLRRGAAGANLRPSGLRSWTPQLWVLFCCCWIRACWMSSSFLCHGSSWWVIILLLFCFLLLLWKTNKKNWGAVRKRCSQTDKLSREQRPLRRCVAQVLNKATCQTAVCKKKKKKTSDLHS